MPDFFDDLFHRTMKRIGQRAEDLLDDFISAAEKELDKALYQAQHQATIQAQTINQQSTTSHRASRERRRTVRRQHQPKTHYEELEVSPTASRETIEAAYRSLAKRLHPDVNKNPSAQDRMKRVNAAWTVLQDEKKRKEYDRSI
jgi:DnaJ-domain-containing protein 1